MNDYYTNEPANRILFSPQNKQNPHRNAQGHPLYIKPVCCSLSLKTKQDQKKKKCKERTPKKLGSARKI